MGASQSGHRVPDLSISDKETLVTERPSRVRVQFRQASRDKILRIILAFCHQSQLFRFSFEKAEQFRPRLVSTDTE